MALDETLILRIQADDAELTVGDLKQGIKDLNKEILSVEKGSEKYNQLVHTLGKARGEFRDIKEEAIAYNPEKRAAAFAQVGTSLAGGFQLATGAMAMMGVESQETQKMLLKVQAATAMAQGVQSIGELGKAFNILKVIIMANPIMTVGVVVTALAGSFLALSQEAEKAAYKIEGVGNKLDELNEKNKKTDAELSILVRQTKEWAKDTQSLKEVISGLNEKELTVFREKLILAAKEQKQIIKDKGEWSVEAMRARDVMVQYSAAWDYSNEVIEKNTKKVKENKEAVKENKITTEDFKKIKRIEVDSIKEGDREIVDSAIATTDKLISEKTRFQEFGFQLSAEEGELRDFTLQQSQVLFSAIGSMQEASFNRQFAAAAGNEAKQEQLRKSYFEQQKRLQIAQALMATYQSAVNTYNTTSAILPPPAPAIAAGLAIVAGLANVAKIKSQSYSGGGGGSVAAPSAGTNFGGGGEAPAPVNRLSGQGTGTTSQDNQFTGWQGQQQPVFKTYVVESEMTETQTKIRKIKYSATFP